jgi:hypothetical protein
MSSKAPNATLTTSLPPAALVVATDLDWGLRADFFGAAADAARFDFGASAFARTLAFDLLDAFALDRTDFLARLTAMLTSWVSIVGAKRKRG